jgi:hypothetical protein
VVGQLRSTSERGSGSRVGDDDSEPGRERLGGSRVGVGFDLPDGEPDAEKKKHAEIK